MAFYLDRLGTNMIDDIILKKRVVFSLGKLEQRPVVELARLRQGAAVQHTTGAAGVALAPGAQVEILVQCSLLASKNRATSPLTAAVFPAKGVVAVNVLQTANKSQHVQVGLDFATKRGFASVSPALGLYGNMSRLDVTPQLDLFNATMTTGARRARAR